MSDFGELRSLLQQTPSTQTWERITACLTQLRERTEGSERFEEQALAYGREHLSAWPDEIVREAPSSWVQRWRCGQWGELVELVRTGLGSFHLYVQAMGSGSVVA